MVDLTVKERFGEFNPGNVKPSTEWEAFAMPGFMTVNKEITPEMLQEEAKSGFVWLDYSCVPQAAEAQPERLRAIESIPHYIDASKTFMALCPPVTHKELGYTCDYHSWRERGWCRLEEQVSELKLYTPSNEDQDGFKRPRRPLIVQSADHITSVDQFDHFYMLGQRRYTVFNGTFACCSLDHKKTFPDGTTLILPCDKGGWGGVGWVFGEEDETDRKTKRPGWGCKEKREEACQ